MSTTENVDAFKYHTTGDLPCEWGGKNCPWDSSDPDGTWICGCGRVKLHVALMNQPFVACYCSDCHNAVAIALDKSGGKYNHYANKTGGVLIANVTMSNVKFVQGAELARGFRCAVKNNGTEFDPSRNTVRVYASCCGTLMYLLPDIHPGILDIAHPDRVKGWAPPYKGVPFPVPPGTKESAFIGSDPGDKGDDKIPICCGEGNICCHTMCCSAVCGHGQCSHLNCSFCHMCKTIGLMTCAAEGTCPLCAPCCTKICCTNNAAAAQFPHPKECDKTKMFNGHPLEDIRDPKYLWGKGAAPTKVDIAR